MPIPTLFKVVEDVVSVPWHSRFQVVVVRHVQDVRQGQLLLLHLPLDAVAVRLLVHVVGLRGTWDIIGIRRATWSNENTIGIRRYGGMGRQDWPPWGLVRSTNRSGPIPESLPRTRCPM